MNVENDVRSLVVKAMANVVSKLPDGSDWQWCWYRCNWWWVSADNRDDLVTVHLQARMETHHDVVGKDTLRVLLRSASFER